MRGPRSWSSHPPRNIPRPQVVRWLEHAYALRDALEPAWTERPLALVQGRPMLLFEDPGREVWPRGFGIGSRIPREHQSPESPERPRL